MRILYVDDEPDLLTIGKIYLEKKHNVFEIIPAGSAKEAFKILEETDIHVIVSDYQMHEVNGLEFLQLVRVNDPDIPFIMFTGRGREEIAIAALNFGADRYIQKGGNMEVQYGVLAQAIYQVYSHSKTKDALVSSEQRYRSLFQTSPDGIIIASLEGLFDFANNGFLTMLGYSMNELLVLTLSEIASERYQQKQRDINSMQLKEQGFTDEFDWEFIAKDGTFIPCTGKLWHEKDRRGNPVHLMGIFRDKTAEKETYDIIKRKSEVEKLILDISTDLINCTTEEIDANMIKTLRSLVTFSNSDHVYLNKLSEDKRHLINIHLVSSKDVRKIERIHSIKLLRTTLKRLMNNETIIISSKEDLSQEVLNSKEVKLEEINSRVSVPLIAKGELIGVIGYLSDQLEKEWNNDELNLLRTVGQIFANTLDRGMRERELAESKERYESLVETMDEGVGMTDQKGNIFYANKRLSEMLGYTNEELKEINFIDIVEIEMKDYLSEAIKTGIFEGGDAFGTYNFLSFRKKEGSIINTSVITYRLSDGKGNYLGSTVVLTDITEKIEAEKKLQISEGRWRYAIDGSELGLWDWDTKLNKSFYSRKLKTMLGYEDHEIGTDPTEWSSRIHPDDYERVMEENSKYLNGEIPIYNSEYRMRCKKGTYKWILARGKIMECDDEGKATRVIGTHMDITEQKELEELLRTSEERWKSALEGSELGVWDWNEQKQEIIYSKQWKTMIGYEENELKNSNEEWLSRIHPDDYERVVEESEQLVERLSEKKDSMYRSEYRMRCKDGSYKWILDTGKVMERDVEGNAVRIIGTHMDITEQKELEELLRTSEERWKFALEGSGLGVWDWNEPTNEVIFSKRWKSILGYEEHELKDTNEEWLSLIHPDDYERVIEENIKYIKGEIPNYHLEYRMRCKDGSYKWILARGKTMERDEDGNPKRIIGIHMDIDESKKLEELLKESEERWKFALDGSEQGVWDYNILTHEVFYSDQWKKMYGFDDEDIGQSVGEWETRIHPDDFESVMKKNQLHHDNKIPFFSLEYRIRCKDGTYKWISDRGKIMERDEEGKAIRVIGTHINISERKELEELLRMSEERWKSALEGSEQGVWDYSMITNETFYSDQWKKMFGYEDEEIGTSVEDWHSRIHPDDYDRVVEEDDKFVKGEIPSFHPEYRMKCKDGTYKWILDTGKVIKRDEEGKPVRIIGTCVDITERKELEELLRLSEERWKFALEGSKQGVWDYNMITNEIFYSDQWKKIFGYEDEDVGKSIKEWHSRIHPDDFDRVVEEDNRFLRGEIPSFHPEYRMKCKDGTYKWVLDRGKVIKRDEEGKPVRVIGTCVDITERKELEELLKANEARWNSALEGSEIGVWDWNIVTNEVFHSKQLETMLGYSEGEVDYPVTDWATKVHPDDLAYVYEQLEAHLGGDTSIYVAEYRYRCKDGSYIWVLDRGKVIEWLEDGKPLRAIGTYLDITQKREDAKKIKTREERWNFALEGSEIGVWDFNQELNETIYSKQWKAMLGYEKDEIGNTYEEWESRLHPDELDLLKESKVNLNAGKTDLFTEEYRMRCKDGSYKWVLDKGKVIEKDADGIPTRVVGMHLDITDRKELEIESDFLSTLLRHDLLNRLIVVNGFLTIIDTSDFSDDNKSYVQKALRAVNQSSELVEKIANLRILRQKIPIEVINLTILCAEVISQTKILAEEKGVTIETDYCTSPCSVKGSHLTKEMLTNLIENSLNHSKGSIIRISTIGAIDEVIMVIEDDGVGIDESIRKKLFQRGVKGKFSKGSGIGLFIVKKIVESSGGLIEVTESELGGVKFEVILPKAK